MLRRTVLAALSCSIVALACVDEDATARREVYDRVSQASDRWYRVAWGGDRPATERDAERRGFECVWSGLRARGVDPLPDFDCLVRAMTAAADCGAASRPVDQCTRAFQDACTFSSAYLDLAPACKEPRP
jgi:hypothetical protein